MASAEKGLWSEEEHAKFLTGLKLFPEGPWKDIAAHIGTRSSRQVQAHAQKYYEKVGRRMRGLRKHRTKLLRPEHRLGEDMTALCSTAELAETGVRIGQIRRGLKAVATRSEKSDGDATAESEVSWSAASMEPLASEITDSSLDWIDVLFQDEELASWIPETVAGETPGLDALGDIDDRCLNYLVEILDSAEFVVHDN